MRDKVLMTTTIVLFLATIVYGVVMLPTIHKWEREAGYPMGRMCDPNLFNLYQSTCK